MSELRKNKKRANKKENQKQINTAILKPNKSNVTKKTHKKTKRKLKISIIIVVVAFGFKAIFKSGWLCHFRLNGERVRNRYKLRQKKNVNKQKRSEKLRRKNEWNERKNKKKCVQQ